MNPSQIPDWPRDPRRWLPLFQPLKSPVTATRSASGAQTAKYTPSVPSAVMTCEPSLS